MSISVIFPWKPGDPAREAALAWVQDRFRTTWPELDLVLGQVPADADWVKADAVADALGRTDAELLVICDADVWCDRLDLAIDQVAAGTSRWAIPHKTVIRLNEAVTARVISGDAEPARAWRGATTRRPYVGMPGGGIVVIRRDCYEEAPFDRRFIGWGYEDLSAGITWRCLHGDPWRGTADLYHLWHPPQPRITVIGSKESQALRTRYQKAARDPERLRNLVIEGRGC